MKEYYNQNVFINCPFDKDFVPLLRVIIFVVVRLGYKARIASERFDSGEPRFIKICELIKKSKFGIHDLPRIKAKEVGELFRLNMPFELGLDIGCRFFGPPKFQSKKLLILDKERYQFQKAISDLSSSDIKSHGNDPIKVLKCVRNWFIENGLSNAPSGSSL